MTSTTSTEPPRPSQPASGPRTQDPAAPAPTNLVAQAREEARSARGTSAQRITIISVASVVVSLLVAVLGFVAAQNRAVGMDRAAAGADRVLQVMAVRNALLEADGAATNAFLVGGLEPQDREQVYDAAIAEAATLLAGLSDGAADDTELIAQLNSDLTTYTGLVEAARVNNRQGYPVGAAYLDQASTLVREQMLSDLDEVLEQAADRAAGDFGAGGWAYLVMGLVLVALVALVVCQVQLARMTRRRLNPGLVIATGLLLVAALAGGLTSVGSATNAGETRIDDYRPTLAVAQASVLASEARSLESFTLIKRGSGQAFEEAYLERTAEAERHLAGGGSDGDSLTQMLRTWVERHGEIRALDDGGDWEGAVALAITDEADGPSAAYAAFVDAADTAIAQGSDDVTSRLQDSANSARLASWLLAAAGVIAAVACWRGTAPRREEYR